LTKGLSAAIIKTLGGWKVNRSGGRHLLFRPFSIPYFLILLLLLILIIPLATIFLRGLFIRGLHLPPEAVGGVLLISLIGSFINIPLTELRSHVPISTYREISYFGVTWYIPRIETGVHMTLITLNVGGALVPILISTYILSWVIPNGRDPFSEYLKTLLVFVLVMIVVYRSSRLIKGLGIATPAFVPPVITALATILLHWLNPSHSPALIAYVGGTLGTLLGADLLNLRKLPRLGASVVSIGGAGTFDGIYTTGLVSVLLVILLL